MDFEITRGVLVSCHGRDEKLVIPRDVKSIGRACHFDFGDRVKTLVLHEGFLGHKAELFYYDKFANTYHDVIKFDNATKQVVKTFMSYDCSDEFLRKPNLYFLLRSLPLRNLERIEVHPDNPVYASRNGLLYTKDMKDLLFVPPKFTGSVELTDGIVPGVLQTRLSANQTRFEFLFSGSTLQYKQLLWLNRFRLPALYFYGPNVTTLETGFMESINNNVASLLLILPKLESPSKHRQILRELALGYCYEPEVFSSEVASELAFYLYVDEWSLHEHAVAKKCRKAKEHLETLWSKLELPTADMFPVNGAVYCLQEAVLRGTVEDVKRVLSEHEKFRFLRQGLDAYSSVDRGGQILGLAARYGGIEKFKCLLECQAYCDSKNQYRKRNLDEFLSHDFVMWLSAPPDLCISVADYSLAFAESGELRNMEPLPESERIEIIKLLLDKGMLQGKRAHIIDDLYLNALVASNYELAAFLKEQGASLAKCIATHNKISGYDTVLHHLIGELKDHAQSISHVFRVFADEGCTFNFSTTLVENLIEDFPEYIGDIFAPVKMSTTVLNKNLSMAIANGSMTVVQGFIKSGLIKTARSLDKFITLSVEQQQAEITAYLLECKETFAKRKSKSKSADADAAAEGSAPVAKPKAKRSSSLRL